MLDAAIEALGAFGWVGLGHALAMRFGPARVQVVPVPVDDVPDAVRFLGDRVDDVVRHVRMTGGSMQISTSGHVTHGGTVIVFALHTLPQMEPNTTLGPEKDNRR